MIDNMGKNDYYIEGITSSIKSDEIEIIVNNRKLPELINEITENINNLNKKN